MPPLFVNNIESIIYILNYYSLEYKVFRNPSSRDFQAIGLIRGNKCSHSINCAGTDRNNESLLKRLLCNNWHNMYYG